MHAEQPPRRRFASIQVCTERGRILRAQGLPAPDLADATSAELFEEGAVHGRIFGGLHPVVERYCPLLTAVFCSVPSGSNPTGEFSTAHVRYVARMRLLRAWFSTSANPSFAMTGGRYMPKRPR